MTLFRSFLGLLLVCIVIYTGITIANHGTDLISPFFGEMSTLSWQGQFNFDFMTFLLISGLWTSWRGGFTLKSNMLGAVATIFGMMFLSAYLLYLSVHTNGDMRRLLLGVHANT